MIRYFIAQLIKFGFVGGSATAAHYVCAVVLITTGVAPLWANFFAFIVAFQVSFWGHFTWTFAHADRKPWAAMRRFFAVSLLGFACNEVLYLGLLSWTALSAQRALCIVLALMAVLTFLLSRQWAFRLTSPSRCQMPDVVTVELK